MVDKMTSKVIVLWTLVAIVVFVSSEVTAKDLVETPVPTTDGDTTAVTSGTEDTEWRRSNMASLFRPIPIPRPRPRPHVPVGRFPPPSPPPRCFRCGGRICCHNVDEVPGAKP